MALATSLAAAISLSPRRTRAAVVVLSLLSLGAPASAVERVYIWRDQSGAVRFSPVQETDRRSEPPTESTATREADVQPAPEFTGADAPAPY